MGAKAPPDETEEAWGRFGRKILEQFEPNPGKLGRPTANGHAALRRSLPWKARAEYIEGENSGRDDDPTPP
jgi:hypothetical protein